MGKHPNQFKPVSLADCSEALVERVLEHERPRKDVAPFYAVFSDSVTDGTFRGLASRDDIALHPGWIFADLVEHRPAHAIAPDTPVNKALEHMNKQELNALPLVDSTGRFIGVVTRTSILCQLLTQERHLLRQALRLNNQVESDRKQIASWSFRLSQLHEASRTLLGVLAHSSLEKDLLQHGIEALTKLLDARYGAIGILDEGTTGGTLSHFHYTGISSEEALRIGRFPEGKGLLGAVIRDDQAIRLVDMHLDPRSAGFPDGHPPMKGLLAVPISHGGHVFGRVYLCDRLDEKPFSYDDELLAMSFAHSLSLVLENSRKLKEMESTQQRLDYLAHFDPLTGLPNRELLTDRIQQLIAHSKRYDRKMAVMFIDIDNFKGINDTYGHGVGDLLIKSVARILSRQMREGDTLARLGGDEFVVALPEINLDSDASQVAEKIVETVKVPILLEILKKELYITVSIGISLFPQDGTDMETLMSHADSAMYQSKVDGKNTYRFFTPSLNLKILQRLKLEQSLRQAIARNELTLAYQPQVDLKSRSIIGVEALLRWNNPDIGAISPGEFIPVAEESGLIIPIGAWVLRRACEQAMQWHEAHLSVRIGVNVSVQQFQFDPHFLQTIETVLQDTRLPPHLLELEITESLMVHKLEPTLDILNAIKRLGVRLSMDDFGTGYSSLSYLKRLPLDVVKIDQSFVRDIAFDLNDAAIVAAITALAKQLKLQVIAEGVENDDQLNFIHKHHCDAVQGYYFGKPMNAASMTALLERGISG